MKKFANKTVIQCVKTARVEHKKASGLALCGAVVAFSGFMTIATRTTTSETWSPAETRESVKIENVAVYENFARAMALLDQGQGDKAQRLLDSVQQERLVLNAGGMGDGMMRAYSPTTLLMALSRRLAGQAASAAKAGNAGEARIWLRYTAQLAEQVAHTPQPNSDAICLSHYIDTYFAESQVRVAQLLGDTQAQTIAQQRCQFLKRTWQTEMLPRLQNHPTNGENGGRSTMEVAKVNEVQLRQAQNRYSLYRIQAGLTV